MGDYLGGYEPHVPLYERPVSSLRRWEARNEFRHVMAVKWGRAEELRRLLARQGIRLVSDEAGLRELEEWYLGGVEWSAGELGGARASWRSVAFDIGLFLGDAMIARNPSLRWQLFTRDKRAAAYHRHVLMGDGTFSATAGMVDVDGYVAGYRGDALAPRSDEPGHFVKLLASATYAV